MKALKDLDFWSTMILVGVLAAVGCGVWNYILHKQKSTVEQAWKQATGDNGDVVKILQLLTEIRALEASQTTIVSPDPGVYLEKQMYLAGISRNEFAIVAKNAKQVTVTVPGKDGKGATKKKAIEEEVRIDFKKMQTPRDRVYYDRKRIFYSIFNAEAQSPVWKLRQLRLTSKEQKSRKKRGGSIQRPLSDDWFIEEMVFVSRRPKADS